jgi:hypothetical protein
VGLQFGEYLLAVQEDLESSVIERLQLQGSDFLLEFFQDFLRQTDGVGFILSSGTVLDCDFHDSR